MNNEEDELNQILAAHKALGESIESILEANAQKIIGGETFEDVGRQLIAYSERLQRGIPRAVPFQLFKIADTNTAATVTDNHRAMIVIDDGQPGDVRLPGAETQCPRCGYHF